VSKETYYRQTSKLQNGDGHLRVALAVLPHFWGVFEVIVPVQMSVFSSSNYYI